MGRSLGGNYRGESSGVGHRGEITGGEKGMEEKEQSLKLALMGQPLICNVGDFVFLTSAHEASDQSSPSQSHLLSDSV